MHCPFASQVDPVGQQTARAPPVEQQASVASGQQEIPQTLPLAQPPPVGAQTAPAF
jgi:hypothetical protein